MNVPLELLFIPLGLAAYWTCLRGPLIFDSLMVLPEAKAWQWSWRWYMKRYGKSLPYRPAAMVSYALDLWRSGVDELRFDRCPGCQGRAVWTMHVTNVALHAGNAFLVEQIAQLLGLPAFLAGLIYLVHPFAVNAVAYIAGRASILSTGFGLIAVWAVLSNHGWMILPALALSVLSKEDGAGFFPLIIMLALKTGHPMTAVIVWAAGLVLFLRYLPYWKEFIAGNGDTQMRAIGLPVSLPSGDHGVTVAVETLLRAPRWAFGFSMSPYHGSGIPVPGAARMFVSGAILALFAVLPAIPAILILIGPWLVYLWCPVPDQLLEYRNYSMVAGFALLLAALPMAWILVPLFLGRTLFLAYAWSSPLQMWKTARDHTSGDSSRAHQEIGAYLKTEGRLWEAQPYLEEAVRLNPVLAPAWDNLAWVHLETGRAERGIRLLEHCVRVCPDYALAFEELGGVYERLNRPGAAERHYLRFLELYGKPHPPVENRLGLVQFSQKKYREAFEWFRKALELSDEYPYAWNCGMALKFAGDYEGARVYQRRFQDREVLGTPEMIRPDYRESA